MFLIIVLKANAQIEISNSQLVGIKWEKTEPLVKETTSTLLFTETCYIDSTYDFTLEKSYTGSKEYYITNDLPSYLVFYKKYVGQERKGCYIVEYNSKMHEVDYYTVISFTGDELILFHKAKPETIPGIDVYIKYRRVKKE